MRLIDADKLLTQIKRWHERLDEEAIMTGNRTICFTWNDAVTLIKHAPTVDAIPIRCKDCRFWEQEQRDKGFGDCMYHLSLTQASDFCSYAERKEKIQ